MRQNKQNRLTHMSDVCIIRASTSFLDKKWTGSLFETRKQKIQEDAYESEKNISYDVSYSTDSWYACRMWIYRR